MPGLHQTWEKWANFTMTFLRAGGSGWGLQTYAGEAYVCYSGGRHDGRQDPHRIGSRGIPALGRAPAFTHRCAEYRADESCRLLPQLPVELDEGGCRCPGSCDEQG